MTCVSRAILAFTIGNTSTLRAIDMEAANRAAALDKGQDGVLMAEAGAGFLDAFLAADESFVDLDDSASAAHGRKLASPHSLADAVRHKPRGLIGGISRMRCS